MAISATALSRPRFVVLCVILVLMPIWVPAMLGRTLWTPDEPREADIAWRMSFQQDRAIPTLAGKPILEKPPLTYWLAGAAVSVAGLHPAVLRAPNLLMAMIASVCVVLLALHMAGTRAAWIAGLCSGSFILSFQVAIWLATDAAVVAGAALALFSAWRALNAASGRSKFGFYCLMAVGLTMGFMAKGPIALLVPGSAYLGTILWNKQWRELRRREFWIAMTLPAAVCGAWIFCVLRASDGRGDLQTMFWWNLVGRFVHLAAPPEARFADGHHNWPGKYLVEAAYYIFPWTFLGIAAGRRAWRHVQDKASASMPWRYLIMGILPPLAILSVAATARGIYAAPLLLPVALLIGLWAHQHLDAPDRFEQRMLRWTLYACLLFGAVMIAIAAFLTDVYGVAASGVAALLTGIGAIAATTLGLRRLRVQLPRDALRFALASGVASLFAVAITMPRLDGAQDLSRLGAALEHDTGKSDLVLYVPDETTLAFVDMSFTPRGRHFDVIDAPEGLRTVMREQPDAKLLMKLNGTGAGPLSTRLPRHAFHRGRTQASNTRPLALLRALDRGSRQRYGLPDGREYLLISPETPEPASAQARNVRTQDPSID